MKNDRLINRLDQVKSLITEPSSRKRKPAASIRYKQLAEAMGGELVIDRAGSFCLVTTGYQFGHRFGDEVLDRSEPTQAVSMSSFTAQESEGEVNLDKLLFIDTETTGLGGAGAVAFLIGCGSWTNSGFEVRQYLLPDYSDEAAMLERVLEEFGPGKTLVSYNGLAFDMNIIRDRMIVNRVARAVPQAGHFDLLHSARRLWRRRLADCSLTNIEREIFGSYRDNDIPGHLIPSVYFDWLQADELGDLSAVLEHNRLDILALYFLLLKIDTVFRTEGASLDYTDDVYSLSRVYGRRRHHEKIVSNFKTLQEGSVGALSDEVLFFHALAYKRSGDWAGAVELWRGLVDSNSRESYLANVELAKYYEHRAKDLRQADECAQKARQAGPPTVRHREQIRLRLARLKRKLRG